MTDPTSSTPSHAAPVTTVVTRHVAPGREEEFEARVHEIINTARSFPGHQGATVLRPDGPSAREYVVVFTFATADDLRRWEQSPQRAELYARLAHAANGPPHTRTATGLETWFTLPWSPGQPPPVRWRMALVTWLAIYPLITALFALIGPALAAWPLPLRTLLVTAFMVPFMTYVLLPRLTRLFARWLYPPPAATPQSRS